ncbi:DNA translocase FtsK, partial [Hansschlegelia zhihuaiae]|uniref:DNA translocase FtsK n=1 Tax=Hansschlegelia zhihuaiae TaxID=405005 RepID=UPI001FDFBB52
MRFSGRPPASDETAQGAAAAAGTRPSVRSVRTPDSVLKARRARTGAEPEAMGDSVAARPRQWPEPNATPSWLQPFASGPNTRFTRTPDSILRGRQRVPEGAEEAQPIDPQTAADAIAGMAFPGVRRPRIAPEPIRRLAEAIQIGDGDVAPQPVEQDNDPRTEVDAAPQAREADVVGSVLTGSLGQPFTSFAPVTYRATFDWGGERAATPAPVRRRPAATSEQSEIEAPKPAPAIQPAPPPAPASQPLARPRAEPALRPHAAAAARPPVSAAYQPPSLDLLTMPTDSEPSPEHSEEALEKNSVKLQQTLQDFGVRGEIIDANPGPVVTLYELEPAPGVKSSRVIALASDIARSMSAKSARVAVVEGRNVIGVELPNARRETVYLRELLESPAFSGTQHKLPVCLGKTIGGEPVIADLARMPHLLVAGTTGSGKSVAINTMILSLLYQHSPEKCRLIMVDPKMLELSVYEGIPHLLTPVVTDPKKAVIALKWAVREMEDRYRKMSKLGVRNIDGFNARAAEAKARGETVVRPVQTGFDKETGQPTYEDEVMDLTALPYIVVIVDEMADLMMVAGKDIEGAIQRLAQMARAAGIHIVMATQRPSVDVITGTIKA